ATQAAFDIAQSGSVISDLFHAMNTRVNPTAASSNAGRQGHGLGMQLTEWPSIIAADHTPLVPGMVLTLEPGITLPDGQIMVHEENIVVTEGAAEWLSTPQPADIRVI
ncbi:MAG: M24 family metallopeptidase, partial [Sulfitobacter geojensis]